MSAPRRPRTAAAAVALAALTLAGCAWRLETEPPVAPSPDAAEIARDEAARLEADVAAALAASAPPASDAEAIVSAHERVANPAYAAIWGPVYVPFPDASPTASPSPAPEPPALAAARAAAQEHSFAQALANADAQAAHTFAAMTVARAVADTYAEYVEALAAGERDADQGGDGIIPDQVQERPLDVAGTQWPLLPAASTLDAPALASLIVAHDNAQYVYEVIAGKSRGQARARAAERARLHRARAAALVTIAGADPRGPGYVIDLAELGDQESRDNLARGAERAVGLAYMAALVDAETDDRAWLMSGAHDAFAAEAVWPGFTPDELPVLPGHTLP